jgi:hypothetical protein
LEIKAQELSKIYTDDYPLVQGIQRTLEHMRKVHDDEKGARTETTFALNPSWQNLRQVFLVEEARLAALTATKKTIHDQHVVVFAEVKQFNRYAMDLSALEREARLLEDSYLAYAEKLEQSRIAKALEAERITNVNVVQEATLQRDPIYPSKTLGAGVGLLLAMVGAIGVSLLAEQRNTTLRSVPEVEAALEIPVLVSIPRSERHRVKL